MFEDSLFESTPRTISARSRWTAAASLAMQALIASLLVVLPLLHTEQLPDRLQHLQVALPLPVLQPPPQPRTAVHQASTTPTAIPILGHAFEAPRQIPGHIDLTPEPAGPSTPFTAMGNPTGLPDALAHNTASSANVSVAPPDKKPTLVRVSAGVSAGLLLTPIRPIYPPIAKAAHLEGSVIVEAIISKTGTIESLHVVRGPTMLQAAALDAIRVARYQPFRLNGEPTEVQTTITVNFVLGG